MNIWKSKIRFDKIPAGNGAGSANCLPNTESSTHFEVAGANVTRATDTRLGNSKQKLQIPDEIDGRYNLFEELATGGMGRVYKAYDRVLNRNIALKILRSRFMTQDEIALRFMEEAQIMARLQHPGVVPVYETGKLKDGRPFIAMKLIEGCTLKNLLTDRSNPKQELAHYINIFEQVCQTVAFGHSRGIIHRDIKPENIMVGAFGEVLVMDWGLAKSLDPKFASLQPSLQWPISKNELDDEIEDFEDTKVIKVNMVPARMPEENITNAGQILGTFQYMPPEQARGDHDKLSFQSDVFSLGALLCELLTGSPPYSSVKAEARRQAQEADLRHAFNMLNDSGADADLIQLAKHCLNENPQDRPKSAEQVALSVGSYLRGVQERLHNDLVRRIAAQAHDHHTRHKSQVIKQFRNNAILTSIALFIVFVTVGSFLLMYRNQQFHQRYVQTAQQESARKELDHKLENVTALLGKLSTNSSDFSQSIDTVEQASQLMLDADSLAQQTAQPIADKARVDELRSQCDSWKQNLILLADLERISFEDDELRPVKNRSEEVGRRYQTAFQNHPLKPLDGPLEDAKARLQGSSIERLLRPYLLKWLSLAVEAEQRNRLSGLLKFEGPNQNQMATEWLRAVQKKDSDTLVPMTRFLLSAKFEAAELRVFAEQIYQLGHPEAAEKILLSAHVNNPESYEVNRDLGRLYRHMPGRSSDAVRFCTAALYLHPRSPLPHLALAVALREDHKDAAALQELKNALKLNETDFQTNVLLAELDREQGRFAQALVAYRRILTKPEDLSREQLGKTRLSAAEVAIQATASDAARAPALRLEALNFLRNQWVACSMDRRPEDRSEFESWLKNEIFAPVRKPSLLEKLDEKERADWTTFWQEVESGLQINP